MENRYITHIHVTSSNPESSKIEIIYNNNLERDRLSISEYGIILRITTKSHILIPWYRVREVWYRETEV